MSLKFGMVLQTYTPAFRIGGMQRYAWKKREYYLSTLLKHCTQKVRPETRSSAMMNCLKIHFMLLFFVLENTCTVNGFFLDVLSGSCDLLSHVF